MKKKILFLFLGHNVPITWSEVLGVNRRNEALGQSFTQRYSTTELWGQNETSQTYEDNATKWSSWRRGIANEKKSNFGLMKLKWIFCNEKKNSVFVFGS